MRLLIVLWLGRAFTDCLQLELIQDGAFANLTLLRTM